MLVRLIGCFMIAAVVAEAAVEGHDLLKDSRNAKVATLADKVMPFDEANDLRRATAASSSNSLTADKHLLDALAKNPYDTDSWIQLSVDAEARGDVSNAEHYIQQAVEHDAGSAPRWAAANFYYRQGNRAQFITWTNNYRERTHEKEAGLFRMVAEVAPEPRAMLDALPRMQCDELGTLADTLYNRQQDPDVVVERMTSNCHDPATQSTLNHLVSNFLAADKPVTADHIWRRMGEPGDRLANPDFLKPVSGEGFDWRINQNHEIAVRQTENQGIRFEFTDKVPSGTILLFQPLDLSSNAPYRLNMNFESEPVEKNAFRWELVEFSSGRHLTSGLDKENIDEQPVWKFQSPDTTSKTIALALFYTRPPGSEPFQGTIKIHGIQLAKELVPNLTGLPAKQIKTGY